MTARCRREGCDRTWDRDPCFEVACPQCGADVGDRCVRPSGWSGPFVTWHKDRDLLALEEGHYGACPLDICAESIDDVDGAADRRSGGASSNDDGTQSSLDAF